ncbi:hypothetical protein TcCL_Unassigned04272, partial [Trypanosoma cruzi]
SPRQQHSLMRLHSLRIFRGGMHCSVCRLCFPIPSVGADSLVDARSYRLRTHSLIDAADTQPIAGASGMTAAPPQQLVQWDWGREHSRTSSIGWCWQPCQHPADSSGEHRNRRDREGIDEVSGHQLSFNITPGQTTGRINDNIIHQQ